MNYRHAFHAGNFADVHKHVVLLAILQRVQSKPKPLFFLDTHAGRGWYDLHSTQAQRGGEWREGIAKLRHHPVQTPALKHYVATVASAAAKNAHGYPGSPLLMIQVMRAEDRVVFVEKDLVEAAALQQACRSRRGVSVVHGDGYQALKTYLPPRENRGLVLMDPPYESDREYDQVLQALAVGMRRWSNGMFVIWYPIKAGPERERFHASLQASGLRKLLALELWVRPADSPTGLNGSGMLIANPPWQLEAEMQPALEELSTVVGIAGQGSWRAQWIVPE